MRSSTYCGGIKYVSSYQSARAMKLPLVITRGSLRNKTIALGIKIGQVVSSPELDEAVEEA